MPLPAGTAHPSLVPRDVSSVELLMTYHQGIRAEMDTRSKSFAACVELGKKLLQRKHQESPEVGTAPGWKGGGWAAGTDPPPPGDSRPLQIKAKLMELLDKRKAMMELWQQRWDRLRLRKCGDGQVGEQGGGVWGWWDPPPGGR